MDHAFVEREQERLLRELTEFLAIPSISALPDHAPDCRRAADWLEQRSAGAPAPLVERTRYYLDQVSQHGDPGLVLARAGVAALEATANSSGDRRAALDLLAADALVTLALLVRAETDPASLGGFAAHLRDTSLNPL